MTTQTKRIFVNRTHMPMQFGFILRALPLFFVLLLPFQTQAAGAASKHAQSVFLFLERGNLQEALAHAKLADGGLLYKFIYWTYIKNGATDIGFHAITDFVDKNPDWPDREILLQRAEIALLVDGATETDAAAWHKRYHERPARSLKELVRATWIKGDFDVVSQRILRTRYKDILRVDDDIARADRLLWEKKYTAIARMIDMLPASHRQMAETRIALQKDARNANALLSKVNSSLQNTPGLVFDRLSWRQRNGQKDGARALMLSVPAEVP